ncbi:MAG: flavin reductase family protein [Nitrososphaeria archaeon]|nr:flavin reductase family protein [Nitrososphaeria archaeon]
MKPRKMVYYKLIVRPVVVISTISERGISNAAPFSFNSPVSFDPPLFGFSCRPTHHTWMNIRKTKEFVVNVVGKNFGPLMHILEGRFPYEVSEIEKAGLTEDLAKRVKPPRIREADAWIECIMEDHFELGDHIWIVGRVLEAEVREELYGEVINVGKASPLAHISGRYFATDMRVEEYERV